MYIITYICILRGPAKGARSSSSRCRGAGSSTPSSPAEEVSLASWSSLLIISNNISIIIIRISSSSSSRRSSIIAIIIITILILIVTIVVVLAAVHPLRLRDTADVRKIHIMICVIWYWCVCVWKNKHLRRREPLRRAAFGAPNQREDRSFRCWISRQRLEQKECYFHRHRYDIRDILLPARSGKGG